MKKLWKINWQSIAIKQKIAFLTGSILLIVVTSCLLDFWVVQFSLVDFYRILEDNSRNSELVTRLENETDLFESYVKSGDREEWELLDEAMDETYRAVERLPLNYKTMGKVLYAKTWSVQNCYEVYRVKRDRVLIMGEESDPEYIRSLYEIYDMQSYLLDYARVLMTEGMEAGNAAYHDKYPWMIGVPAVVIVLMLLFFYMVIKMGRMIHESIVSPVIQLADASQKIAANDFYIEDIKVENKDEMGELVQAFNKMKYATGHYIQTLEEKRMALNKLHEKEVERLEMERRLESAKMELLMSQINPHFLFNTLNVIGGMANLEDAETTEKMIKALSDLLRYTLKNDQAVATLERELKVIEDYMYLQHMRFGSRIAYELSCRADAAGILIPTFTFQPLVENAIIHGLSPKVKGGKIRICIREKAGGLSVAIGDNGVGMSVETLGKLRAGMEEKNGEDLGIGFSNVYKRVKAMYPDTKISLYSVEKKGTVVRMQIPVLRKKEDGEGKPAEER